MLQLKVTDKPYCAKETRFVKTVCLPNMPFTNGTECVISGWGVTETREYHSKSVLSNHSDHCELKVQYVRFFVKKDQLNMKKITVLRL